MNPLLDDLFKKVSTNFSEDTGIQIVYSRITCFLKSFIMAHDDYMANYNNRFFDSSSSKRDSHRPSLILHLNHFLNINIRVLDIFDIFAGHVIKQNFCPVSSVLASEVIQSN